MDARVNDFLNEINEIAPPPKITAKDSNECVWQECYDEASQFPYYWNINTNAVTWEMPPEYQEWLNANKASQKEKMSKNHKPLFPSVTVNLNNASNFNESRTLTVNKIPDSSDIKKIRALASYSIDSDNESLEDNNLSKNGSVANSPLRPNSINSKSSRTNSDNETEIVDEVKPTLGFSLLANYGGSEDEDTPSEDESESVVRVIEKSEGHSTLFPATKPIDINQFSVTENTDNDRKVLSVENEEIDLNVKAFKRKRRIGVHLVNTPKSKSQNQKDENEKTGKIQSQSTNEDGNQQNSGNTENYKKYKEKFGPSFVKGDTLQPTISETSAEKNSSEANTDTTNGGLSTDVNVDETQTTLKEKLGFLSEGREDVSPVQIMSIQLGTLYNAWKSGNLNLSYFTSWIKDISNDLVKLEEDAAPAGWLLDWDRQEKRYYYRNKSSNQCQWQYPVPGIKAQESEHVNAEDDDDAMDICTTPPPPDACNESNIEVTTITAAATDDKTVNSVKEREDANCINSHKNKREKEKDKEFNSVLDSFYSDIADIETTQQQQMKTDEKDKEEINTSTKGIKKVNSEVTNPSIAMVVENNAEPPRKKKKVKLSQGISMKKKAVSQLVEKWKNVQKDLD